MYDLAFWGRSASNQSSVEDERFAIRGVGDDLAASLPDNCADKQETEANSFVRFVNNEGEEHRLQDFIVSGRLLNEDN